MFVAHLCRDGERYSRMNHWADGTKRKEKSIDMPDSLARWILLECPDVYMATSLVSNQIKQIGLDLPVTLNCLSFV